MFIVHETKGSWVQNILTLLCGVNKKKTKLTDCRQTFGPVVPPLAGQQGAGSAALVVKEYMEYLNYNYDTSLYIFAYKMYFEIDNTNTASLLNIFHAFLVE